jgi:hypothetical protein
LAHAVGEFADVAGGQVAHALSVKLATEVTVGIARWGLFRRREDGQSSQADQADKPRTRHGRAPHRRGIPTTALELAERCDDGVEVVLLWDPATEGRVWVDVLSRASGEGFVIDAGSEIALDVFYHPFAYALRAA